MSSTLRSRARAFATAGAALIIFFALMSALLTLHIAVSNVSEELDAAIDERNENWREMSRTEIEIVGAEYVDGSLVLTVRNTGSTDLRLEDTDLLLDGQYFDEGDFSSTTIEGDPDTRIWRPGENLRITVPTDAPRNVRVVTEHGITALLEIFPFSDGDELAFAQSDVLASAANNSGVTSSYGTSSALVTGPMVENFATTGTNEIPFVNSSGALKIATPDGTVTQLTTGADATDSRLAVGRWQSTAPSVFYVDEGTGNVRRVTANGTDLLVEDAVTAEAVSGPADVDGDDAPELVYGDTSQSLRYVDDDGSIVEVGAGYGSNAGIGLGEPADFDGDGTARMPIVTGSNNVALVNETGTVTALTGSGPAAKSPVGTFDWDRDGEFELVFVDTGGTLAYVDNVTSGNDVKTITEGGSTVSADEDTGAA